MINRNNVPHKTQFELLERNAAAAAAAAKLLQSCPTLCDPLDGSPPGSPIPGILLAPIKMLGQILGTQ